MVRFLVMSLLLTLSVALVPAPASAMSDGNRALRDRQEAAEAAAVEAGETPPVEAPAGGSGPRGAGVAIAIVAALVLIGLIIVAAGPAIAFDEATSGYE